MKVSSSLFAFACMVFTASAGNLLINGDFEAGALSPWEGGIVSTAGANHLLSVTPSAKQTVATEPGTKYYAAVDVGNAQIGGSATITATPTGGVIPDGSKIFSSTPIGIPPIILVPVTVGRMGFVFTASTASTDIVLSTVVFPGIPDTTTFDNVVLHKISSSRFAGRYSGTSSTTLSVVDPAISNKSSVRATARVGTDGRFVVLLGTSQVISGILLA